MREIVQPFYLKINSKFGRLSARLKNYREIVQPFGLWRYRAIRITSAEIVQSFFQSTQQTELEATPKVSEPILAVTAGTSQCWAVGLDGLYQHKDSDWVQVISAQELPVRGWLQAVSQAVTEHVWLGTSAGLLVYNPDTGKLAPVGGALGSADVRSVFAIPKDESELLWVGTTQGLYVGNSDNWESVPDLENRTITALAWDGDTSSLWVGTDLGLFRLVSQDNGWKIANEFNVHNSGLGANRVNAIAIGIGDAGETKMWVGTPCGLSCYSY